MEKNKLMKFQKFGKKNEVKTNSSKEVWSYTRVSSIDQKDNYSLLNQEQDIKKYAEENGYDIIHPFGGIYESAKEDFTRKEFQKLINAIQKSRRRPFAVIIYKMNRFSRSGGSGVGLAEYLVNELGVHLIEAISGMDTTTEKGQLEIYRKLLSAREENITRLEHTIPGMESFLKAGNWLGVAPMGYDHYGTRVHDFDKRSMQQNIRLNEVGKKLQLAWQWKSEGETDVEIIRRLKELGVEITSQRISAMWRNIFYCGLIANKLLKGNVIEGNHEAMVSKELFLKVQDIINNRKQGYTVVKQPEERPLTGHLFCSVCGNKLTSHEHKAKKLHYYKCQNCNGSCINTSTPLSRLKNKGAHEMFVDLLDSYQLDDKFLDLFKIQLEKMLGSVSKEKRNEDSLVKKQLTELKNKKENLEERFAFKEIEYELYNRLLTKINTQICEIGPKDDISENKISNLKSQLNKSVEFTQNISKHWVSASIGNKKRIQKVLFPDGLVIDTKNRQYLTSKVNSLFALKRSISDNIEDKEKGLTTNKSDKSSTVAGTRIELVTSGL